MLETFQQMITKMIARRERDATRFRDSDGDLCMLCGAYGDDKRGLVIDCGYDVTEMVPEALDLGNVGMETHKQGFYVRLCKTCRGELLDHLRSWRRDRVAMRDVPKNHDGYPEDAPGWIAVRIDGISVMMSAEQYEEYQRRKAEGE